MDHSVETARPGGPAHVTWVGAALSGSKCNVLGSMPPTHAYISAGSPRGTTHPEQLARRSLWPAALPASHRGGPCRHAPM
eukprot:3142494-Prymnesium_polylepis.3